MAINYFGRKMRARTLALMFAGALGLSGGSVQSQTVQRELPPPPIPELPSVSEYSLPPGDAQRPTRPTVQGPVEENGLPPQAPPKRDEAQSGSPPVIVAPIPRAGQATTNQSQPAPGPSPSGNTQRPTAASSSPRTTSPPSADSGLPSASDPTPSIGAQDAVLPERQPQPDVAAPSDLPVPGTVPEAASSATPQQALDTGSYTNSAYYYGGGIFFLLLSGLGYYFWRRKTSAVVLDDEISDAPVPVPVPRKPAPKIYSPPNPAEPKKPAPASQDGFVTSKIGGIRKSPSTSATIPLPQVPQSGTNLAKHLQIGFIAHGASSTLLNAVLNYAVTLTNISDQELRDIRLSGAMMQADNQNARDGATLPGDVLHITESLRADETVTLTGDIRLPLSAIRPIIFKSQALFIPLAHFGIEYLDDNGTAHRQSSSFIIGREYEPPRAKMAPFRLDLGPRSFGPVGQRPLVIS